MTRLVFASCMHSGADDKQRVWRDAAAHEPDWLVLGGDNIYMDYGLGHLNESKAWSLRKFKDEMFARYARQFSIPSFQALVKKIPHGQVVGVWDDHDFAWNNCYGTDTADGMPDKQKIAASLYHQYFMALNARPLPGALPELPMPDLQDPPNGMVDIYRALPLGPVTALLCDCRRYRERNPHGTNPVSLLGAAQEEWLFGQLNSGAGPFVIISGSTMTAADDQSWDYYQDFFHNRFLPAVTGKTVIFVGGDVHKNRLPPRIKDWPVEVVSSAAALTPLFFAPRFGVIELDADEARFFLYKSGKVEYTGKFDWGSGKFKTNMIENVAAGLPRASVRRARSQRASAMAKLKAMR